MGAIPRRLRDMSIFNGVSQCWPLSTTCVVWWDAWAAVGAWVAATVTFLAVLLPFRQGQKEKKQAVEAAKREATLALEHFVLTIIDFRAAIANAVKMTEALPVAEVVGNTVALLLDTISRAEYPVLPANAALWEVRSDLAYLRRTMSVFGDYQIAFKQGRLTPQIIEAYISSLKLAEAGLNQTVIAIQPYVRNDLQLILK